MENDFKEWSRTLMDQAVRGVEVRGLFDSQLIEARPAWALPQRLLLGQVREQSNPRRFSWFICGEVPLDYLPSDHAATPREALRYFSMKWQLDAERESDAQRAQALIEDAEALYALADDDRFWQS